MDLQMTMMMIQLLGHKGAIEDSYNDNLEGLVDDEPNLYETSAVEGSPVLL